MQRLYRWSVFFEYDRVSMFRGTGAWSSWWRAKSTANLDAYLKRIAPAEYYDKLKPDFPMGCKRVAYNLGWYVAPAS